MLTAKGETYDKVLGLELGADDYIVKPFETKEVTARIKAVLRRCGSKDEENKGVYDFDNLHLDMNRYELKVKGKVVDAPPKELELLACLAGHPNRVYTRDQLLDEVWGFEYYGDSRTIDVHVKRLREKLEGASEQWNLKTVWGVVTSLRLKNNVPRQKEENNGAAPLRSVSGEVFATFASLLLVALVLMCMLQTGLSCAYFAQERKSALTAVLDGATAMAETYASEGNIVTLPAGTMSWWSEPRPALNCSYIIGRTCVCGRPDGNILMHTGKDVAESAKIPQNLQEEMDSGKDIFLMGTMDDTLHDKYYIAGRRVNLGR